MADPNCISRLKNLDWIHNLSPDKRSCILSGYLCVADFDITPEAIDLLALDILHEVEEARSGYDFDTLNIGLYDEGRDIRVWRVSFR